MKFYIFSFLLHFLLLFSITKLSTQEVKLDSKNVVIYLNELKFEEKTTPEPAPLKNVEKVKTEEKKNVKKVEKKEIQKKKEEKKSTKKVKSVAKKAKDISKEDSTNNLETQKPFNPLEGLVIDGNGTYIGDQKNNQGIGYRIKHEVNPLYPPIAKKIGFKDEVVIKTKFLVGLNGKIEDIIFLNNFTDYGFQREVEKALKRWEFYPIIYHGKNIKMYFYKDFRFNVK